MAFANVTQVAEADFPTRWGHFRILGFEGQPAAPLPGCAREGVHQRLQAGALQFQRLITAQKNHGAMRCHHFDRAAAKSCRRREKPDDVGLIHRPCTLPRSRRQPNPVPRSGA